MYIEARKLDSDCMLDSWTKGEFNLEENDQRKTLILGISSLFCCFSMGKSKNTGKLWINPVTGPPFQKTSTTELHAMNVVKGSSNMPMINFIINADNITELKEL